MVEGSASSDGDSMYLKVKSAALKINDTEKLKRLPANGDLVAVPAIYHRRKGHYLKDIADVYTSNDQNKSSG